MIAGLLNLDWPRIPAHHAEFLARSTQNTKDCSCSLIHHGSSVKFLQCVSHVPEIWAYQTLITDLYNTPQITLHKIHASQNKSYISQHTSPIHISNTHDSLAITHYDSCYTHITTHISNTHQPLTITQHEPCYTRTTNTHLKYT